MMRNIALWASMAALAANVIPSALFLAGRMELDAMKTAMLWATIAWYAVASFWIYGTKPSPIDEPVVP
jgi:hypothetical protein